MRGHVLPGALSTTTSPRQRGTDVGERERESQRVFWERWGRVLRRARRAHVRGQADGSCT